MDDLEIASLIYLDDEESSEDKKNHLEESVMFKKRKTEGLFQILVRRHLHCNDEKFRQDFWLTPILFDYVLNHIRGNLSIFKKGKRHFLKHHQCSVFVMTHMFVYLLLVDGIVSEYMEHNVELGIDDESLVCLEYIEHIFNSVLPTNDKICILNLTSSY
ncbi:Hypothetical protein CINCED_3A008225 [Cinara cedri]|uniref:Uncharacterized protein n=1 Tax=Cinara cedri TaxID=506608 RepID=A0A5E4NMK3_9HEMI|nr:Hypothetical protein CINCED_3A008225 [Cinara cedri]